MTDVSVYAMVVLGAFGTLVAFEIYNTLIGHRIPEWLKPIIMAAIAYGVMSIPWPMVRLAVAATGVVALLRAIIVWFTTSAEKPAPITWNRR